MTRMMVDIVKASIAHYDDIDVVGEVSKGYGGGLDGLIEAAGTTGADVILISSASEDISDYGTLLYQQPRLKILTISADGRNGFLHELVPKITALGEVSPDVLVAAIRSPSCDGHRDGCHG
jgi:hypothetical protein